MDRGADRDRAREGRDPAADGVDAGVVVEGLVELGLHRWGQLDRRRTAVDRNRGLGAVASGEGRDPVLDRSGRIVPLHQMVEVDRPVRNVVGQAVGVDVGEVRVTPRDL